MKASSVETARGAQVRVLGPRPEDEALLSLESFFHTPRHEGERETVLKANQWLTHVVIPASGVTIGDELVQVLRDADRR